MSVLINTSINSIDDSKYFTSFFMKILLKKVKKMLANTINI